MFGILLVCFERSVEDDQPIAFVFFRIFGFVSPAIKPTGFDVKLLQFFVVGISVNIVGRDGTAGIFGSPRVAFHESDRSPPLILDGFVKISTFRHDLPQIGQSSSGVRLSDVVVILDHLGPDGGLFVLVSIQPMALSNMVEGGGGITNLVREVIDDVLISLYRCIPFLNKMQAPAHPKKNVRKRLAFPKLKGVGLVGGKGPFVVLFVEELISILEIQSLKGIQFHKVFSRIENFLPCDILCSRIREDNGHDESQ